MTVSHIVVERTNFDPCEDTWQWVLFVGVVPIAVSWDVYCSARDAYEAAEDAKDAFNRVDPDRQAP